MNGTPLVGWRVRREQDWPRYKGADGEHYCILDEISIASPYSRYMQSRNSRARKEIAISALDAQWDRPKKFKNTVRIVLGYKSNTSGAGESRE